MKIYFFLVLYDTQESINAISAVVFAGDFVLVVVNVSLPDDDNRVSSVFT